MSAQSALLVRVFPVGKRTVTMTFQHPSAAPELQIMATEWEPNFPRGLSRKEWRQYRAGRDAAIIEYGHLTGLKIALIEP